MSKSRLGDNALGIWEEEKKIERTREEGRMNVQMGWN